MKLSVPLRMTLTICGTVMAVAAMTFAYLGGTDIPVGTIVAAVVALLGSLAAGLGIAGGPSPRGGIGAGLLALVFFAGCAPCVAEQAIVSAVDVGLDAAESSVGDAGGEDWERSLGIARGASLLGIAAVDACELVRDSAGWQAWVGLALETAGAVAAHFGAADDPGRPQDPPDELVSALSMLEGESGP